MNLTNLRELVSFAKANKLSNLDVLTVLCIRTLFTWCDHYSISNVLSGQLRDEYRMCVNWAIGYCGKRQPVDVRRAITAAMDRAMLYVTTYIHEHTVPDAEIFINMTTKPVMRRGIFIDPVYHKKYCIELYFTDKTHWIHVYCDPDLVMYNTLLFTVVEERGGLTFIPKCETPLYNPDCDLLSTRVRVTVDMDLRLAEFTTILSHSLTQHLAAIAAGCFFSKLLRKA